MIVARVALGDPYYALEALRDHRRPPQRDSGSGLHQSVVANPGRMANHPKRRQAHQEFVIFDVAQAYPCFVVQYRVAA